MYTSNIMLRTQIYIPEPIHQAAKTLARSQNESLAKLLRRLIVAGLKEEKAKIKPKNLSSLIGLNITGGPKDLSSKIDKYLYQK